jgi:hypothetical protein
VAQQPGSGVSNSNLTIADNVQPSSMTRKMAGIGACFVGSAENNHRVLAFVATQHVPQVVHISQHDKEMHSICRSLSVIAAVITASL